MQIWYERYPEDCYRGRGSCVRVVPLARLEVFYARYCSRDRGRLLSVLPRLFGCLHAFGAGGHLGAVCLAFSSHDILELRYVVFLVVFGSLALTRAQRCNLLEAWTQACTSAQAPSLLRTTILAGYLTREGSQTHGSHAWVFSVHTIAEEPSVLRTSRLKPLRVNRVIQCCVRVMVLRWRLRELRHQLEAYATWSFDECYAPSAKAPGHNLWPPDDLKTVDRRVQVVNCEDCVQEAFLG